MTSVNFTETSVQDNTEDWNYETMYFIESFLILSTIITLGCIVVFMTFLKKLKYTLKVILISLCIHNAIGFTIEAVVFGIWSQEMDEMSCSVMNILSKSIIVITMEHLALVSFIRHHLSTTTAKNENANTKLIIGLVAAEYFIEYFINIVGVLLSTTGYEVICIDDSSLKAESTWFSAIYFPKVVFIFGAGFYFDYKLVGFLKKRNNMAKNGPGEAKLVPWKTNSEDYDFLIPVSASVASGAISLVFVMIVAALTHGALDFSSIMFIATTVPTIIMAIQIALTLRVAKLKKSPPPAIERKLNFHDNEDEDLEIPQELFHRAQLEENKFRRDVHSVAGDIIGKRLENVAVKLSMDIVSEVIHVRPFDEGQATSSKDITERDKVLGHPMQDDDEIIQEEMELHFMHLERTLGAKKVSTQKYEEDHKARKIK